MKQLISLLVVIFSTSPAFLQNSELSGTQSKEARLEKVWVRFSPEDQPLEVQAEIIDGYVIFEGDIILGTEKEILESRSAVVNGAGNRWPNGVIPYVIQASHPQAHEIRKAINYVYHTTNLCLVERTTETSYVKFVSGSTCASSIGRKGGEQHITIGSGCSFGNIVHEICHAAGFFHEHSRQDRDTYITINWLEIEADKVHNFNKHSSGTDLGPYDYESIMHYPSNAFSFSGQNTIDIKIPPGTNSTAIGQRSRLSAGDIQGINNTYAVNCKLPNLTFSNNSSITKILVNTFSFKVEVINIGRESANSSTVKYYLSTDTNISDSDQEIGSDVVPSLSVGQKYTLSKQINVTGQVSDGTYYLGFIIDENEEVGESNEADNFGAFSDCRPIHTGGGAPNLRIAHGGTGLFPVSGSTFSFNIWIYNSGTAKSESSVLKVFLSKNLGISHCDEVVESRSIPPMGIYADTVGAILIYRDTITIDASDFVQDGSYYIGFMLDADNDISESNEDDNIFHWSSQTVTVGSPEPNLNLDARKSLAFLTDDVFSSFVEVVNNGNTSSSSTYVKYYLSTDSLISADDYEIGSDYISSLSPGASSLENITADLGGVLPGGDFYFGYIIDPDSAIAEGFENDNNIGLYNNGGPLIYQDLVLTNSDNFSASDVFQARNTIISHSLITPGEAIIYEAGNYIALMSGFEAMHGCDLTARIMNYSGDNTPFVEELTTSGSSSSNRAGRENEKEDNLPAELYLEVFPNPFVNCINLEYFLLKNQMISLTIYNSFGQIIKQPISRKPHTSGTYHMLVSLRDHPPGVYFATLNSGDKIITKRMILLKNNN